MKFYISSILLLSVHLCLAAGISTATISGKLAGTRDGDSIIITSYPYGMELGNKRYTGIINNENFTIIIKGLKGPTYLYFSYPNPFGSSAEKYLVEPGDHVIIDRNNKGTFYSGKGALNFTVRDSLTLLGRGPGTILKARQTYLLKYRMALPKNIYSLLAIDILAENELISKDKSSREKLLTLSKLYPGTAGLSSLFYKTIYPGYYSDSVTARGEKRDLLRYIDYIVENYKGLLREKLLVEIVYAYKHRDVPLAAMIKKADPYIKDIFFKQLIANIKSNDVTGAKAYNFKLYDRDGKVHRLSDYTNKVVIIDFWYTYCGPCMQLNTKLKPVEQQFLNDTSVVFISISNDPDFDRWKEMVDGGKYTTSDRINLQTAGKGKNDPVFSFYNIAAYPTLLIIDKKGRMADKVSDPRTDDGKALKLLIEKLRDS